MLYLKQKRGSNGWVVAFYIVTRCLGGLDAPKGAQDDNVFELANNAFKITFLNLLTTFLATLRFKFFKFNIEAGQSPADYNS